MSKQSLFGEWEKFAQDIEREPKMDQGQDRSLKRYKTEPMQDLKSRRKITLDNPDMQQLCRSFMKVELQEQNFPAPTQDLPLSRQDQLLPKEEQEQVLATEQENAAAEEQEQQLSLLASMNARQFQERLQKMLDSLTRIDQEEDAKRQQALGVAAYFDFRSTQNSVHNKLYQPTEGTQRYSLSEHFFGNLKEEQPLSVCCPEIETKGDTSPAADSLFGSHFRPETQSDRLPLYEKPWIYEQNAEAVVGCLARGEVGYPGYDPRTRHFLDQYRCKRLFYK